MLNSWYEDATDDLNPSGGETTPVYPKTNGYSWLKAPRYRDEPFEAGPLARMWVNGDYRDGISVMDRHLARAYEALKVAKAMGEWLHELDAGAPVIRNYGDPSSGTGVGLTEAPRGALGHWASIDNGAADPLPGDHADLLERLAQRRRQLFRADGAGADRHPGHRPGPAGRGAARDPLLRPVPVVCGPRHAAVRKATVIRTGMAK